MRTNKAKKRNFFKDLIYNRQLYLMMLPGLIMYILFNYLPMAGLVLAFKKINFRQNIFLSPWNGFDNFKFMTNSASLWHAVRNTLLYNIAIVFAGLFLSIALAILLDLIRGKMAKKLYQTVMIMPHFLSWVIVSYLVFGFLGLESGYLNHTILPAIGIEPINWYQDPAPWPAIIIIVYFWKEWGYSSVIYSAALSGVDVELYEAADMDGASLWQKLMNVTLPAIKPMITTMLILKIGSILTTDMGLFYQVPLNTSQLYSVTDVLSTYTYNLMMNGGSSSMGMASAASFVQSIISFFLVLGANKLVTVIDKDSEGAI